MKLELSSTGRGPTNRPLRKQVQVETGDPEFDKTWGFWIQNNYVEPGQALISSGVRWQAQQIAAVVEVVPVTITIDRGWLTIHKQCFIKEEQGLEDFVRFCLELFDQLLLTQSEGISFREEFVLGPTDESNCPVCASEIEGNVVLCVRCKTPHCLECWQYNVKCGMYACDETRYMMVGGSEVT